jgi:hypothetical protein
MTVTAGSHKVRAVKAAFVNSSKNTPGVTVTLKILATDDLIDATLWLSEGAKKRTAESLAVLGFDGEDLETVTKNEAIAVIEPEEYEGKTYMRVKWINDPARGGGQFAEMAPAQKQSVMSELRGLVLAHKQTEKKADANFGGKKPLF